MNWIRVAVSIGRDPSIIAMARALGVSTPLTTGCCVLVFAEIGGVSKSGDLSEISDDALEVWAQWSGKRGKFADAFRAHLCTKEGVIRSWDKHNGAAIRESDRKRDAAKQWRDEAKAKRNSSDHVADTERIPYPSRSDSTGRDVTVRTTNNKQTESAVAVAPSPKRRAVRPSVEVPKWPHFPDDARKAVYERWSDKLGVVPYPRLIAALGPCFRAEGDAGYFPVPIVVRAVREYTGCISMGRSAPFASPEDCAKRIGVICRALTDCAHDPMARAEKVMVALHGTKVAA